MENSQKFSTNMLILMVNIIIYLSNKFEFVFLNKYVLIWIHQWKKLSSLLWQTIFKIPYFNTTFDERVILSRHHVYWCFQFSVHDKFAIFWWHMFETTHNGHCFIAYKGSYVLVKLLWKYYWFWRDTLLCGKGTLGCRNRIWRYSWETERFVSSLRLHPPTCGDST